MARTRRPKRSTRAGGRRKTRRAASAPLNLAYGRRAKPRRNAIRRPPPRRAGTNLARLDASRKRAQARVRKLSGELANPAAARALGMGVYGGALTVAGGGAIAGVTSELFPSIMGVDTRLIAGAALVAWGGMSKADPAQIAACLGSGMLACYAEDIASGVVGGEGFTFFEQTTTTATGTNGG